jgi:hypothetical protein
MNKWFFLIVIFDFRGSGGVVYLSDTACPDLILIDVGDSGGVVVVIGFWMVEWVTGVEKRRRKEK